MRFPFSFRLAIIVCVLSIAIGAVVPAMAQQKSITDQMRSQLDQQSVALPGLEQSGGIEKIIGRIIQAFLSIMGILFLALMVYGGYKWMLAQGREEEVTKAKGIIRSAIIGLGVVLAAYVISVFIVTRFQQAAVGQGNGVPIPAAPGI